MFVLDSQPRTGGLWPNWIIDLKWLEISQTGTLALLNLFKYKYLNLYYFNEHSKIFKDTAGNPPGQAPFTERLSESQRMAEAPRAILGVAACSACRKQNEDSAAEV